MSTFDIYCASLRTLSTALLIDHSLATPKLDSIFLSVPLGINIYTVTYRVAQEGSRVTYSLVSVEHGAPAQLHDLLPSCVLLDDEGTVSFWYGSSDSYIAPCTTDRPDACSARLKTRDAERIRETISAEVTSPQRSDEFAVRISSAVSAKSEKEVASSA